MFSKLKQFKDIRDKAKGLQSQLAAEKFEGSGAWGKVHVTINGNQEIEEVTIDDSLLAPNKKKDLESGIKDAHKDANNKARKKIAEIMKASGDFDIPGLTS
jgi:DNA-binding YbaB/EbfC family protein